MNWMNFPDERVRVDGLPWFEENSPSLWRLPERMAPSLSEAVWYLAKQPAGSRLRFSTDSTELGIRVNYPEAAGYVNMSIIGQMGIDVYLDGVYAKSFAPQAVTESQVGQCEQIVLEGLEKEPREVCIYLPNYALVDVLAIGVSDDANLGEPTGYTVERPVAFYGSSITQGGCAGRSGMSYQAILGRMLDIDVVNLGLSGNGLGEPELAEAMAEIDASVYVLDFAVNLPDAAAVERVYAPFMKIIRDRRPDVPMICVTPIFASAEFYSQPTRERLGGMRDVVRKAVAERVVDGDQMLRLVEGYSLLGPDIPDGHVDGVHPNDIGFLAMADGLAPHVAELLGL
jgi:hypothetical protein